MSSGQHQPVKRGAFAWLVTGGGCAVLLLLITLTGGFSPAVDHGRTVPPGEAVQAGPWRIEVLSAELINVAQPGGYAIDDTLRIRVNVTQTGDETITLLPDGLVRLAATTSDDSLRWHHVGPNRTFAFDPGVTEPVIADQRWPAQAPDTVRVVIRDLRWHRGLLWDDWQVGADLAHIDVPVVDRRERD